MWRVLFILAGVVLSAFTLWAFVNADFGDDFERIQSLVFGRQVIADLYLGILFSFAIIFTFEKNKVVACLWALPCIPLGNIWTFLWFAYRWPEVRRRLSRN